MKDQVRFHYFEADIEIACVICDTVFWDSPCIGDTLFNCPKCNRPYQLTYGVRTLSKTEEIQAKAKKREKSKKISFNDL